MLQRLHKSMEKRDEGFTLIELLVVMIIIGILAAIAIPIFLNQRNKGYDTQTKSDVKNASTAEEAYRTDHAAYLTCTEEPAAGTKECTAAVTGLPGWTMSGGDNKVVATAVAGDTFTVKGTASTGKSFCYDSSKSGDGVVSC